MEYVIISGGVAQDFTDGVQVIDMDNLETSLALDELYDIWTDLKEAPRDVAAYAEDVRKLITEHPDFDPDNDTIY
jgi:hypothetical protein